MTIKFENIIYTDEEVIELVRTWRNNKNISKYMLTNHYISKDEHELWIKKLKSTDRAKTWVIKYKDKPIGIASLSDIDYGKKITDWGFYIAEESSRGKGVGSSVLYNLIEYVFGKMNFVKMKTMVLSNNGVALKLYEKFGFKKEDIEKQKLVRDGKKVDVIKVALDKNEWKEIKEKIKRNISHIIDPKDLNQKF